MNCQDSFHSDIVSFDAVIDRGDLFEIKNFVAGLEKYRNPLIHHGAVYAFNQIHPRIEVIEFLANLAGLCVESNGVFFVLENKRIKNCRKMPVFFDLANKISLNKVSNKISLSCLVFIVVRANFESISDSKLFDYSVRNVSFYCY